MITVGSSDVAAVLGLSPWQSPWGAWSRLVGLVPRYSETDTAAQARGRWMEPALAQKYAIDRQIPVWPGPPIGHAPIPGPEPWMHARPDYHAGPGWVWSGDLGRFEADPRLPRWLVEIKTTRRYAEVDGWGPTGTDRAPVYYLVQCVWEAVVCDVELVDLVAYATIEEEERNYPLRPSERLRRGIVDRVRAWYERHVLGETPPPIDGSDACSRALARIHSRSGPDHREASPEDLALVDRLRRARSLSRRVQAEEERVANEVRAAIGADLGLRSGRTHLVTWSHVRGRARLDRAAVDRDHPGLLARYTTQGEPSRRLSPVHGEPDVTDPR